jgi:hypothetical protein
LFINKFLTKKPEDAGCVRINWSSGLSQGATQAEAYVDAAHAAVSLFIDRIPNLLVAFSKLSCSYFWESLF